MLKNVSTQELKLFLHIQVGCILCALLMLVYCERPRHFNPQMASSWWFTASSIIGLLSTLLHLRLCQRGSRPYFERALCVYSLLSAMLLSYLLIFS